MGKYKTSEKDKSSEYLVVDTMKKTLTCSKGQFYLDRGVTFKRTSTEQEVYSTDSRMV